MENSEKQKKAVNEIDKHPLLKELFTATFAMPAALNILAEIDERLDFTLIIERLLLGYEKVIAAVWSWVSNILGVELFPFRNWLTLAIVLVLPALIKTVPKVYRVERLGSEIKLDAHPVFILLSITYSVLLICLLDLLEETFLLIVCTSFFIPVFLKMDEDWGIGRRILFAILAIFVCSLIFDMSEAKYGLPILLIPIVAVLVYVMCWTLLLSSIFSPKFISYIGLWATGIVMISYIANSVLPRINALLDTIGV